MTIGAIFPNLAGLLIVLTGSGLACAIALRHRGARDGARYIPAILLIAVFLSITHLPVPGPDWNGCDSARTRPLLTPLRFIDAVERRWGRDLPVSEWLAELTVSSTALNLHACIVIGAALALCVRKWSVAVLIGAAMTCLVEVSQLTGFFGIYRCAWRQFEVDDLILNATGVAIGFAFARLAGVRPRDAGER